jgi:hypothetical protein
MPTAEINRATTGALVPLVPPLYRTSVTSERLSRPDPSFVTHLIAMAEQSPQTRLLRRATPKDVEAAYRSVANQNQTPTQPGVRMRQIA